jgi:hypothetical protein
MAHLLPSFEVLCLVEWFLLIPLLSSLQCVEALLHPLDLKNWDEVKTMTDKFAAVCILQVHTPNNWFTLITVVF